MTSSCKVSRLRVGELVTLAQFRKSALSCSSKFVEGRVQDIFTSEPEGTTLRRGRATVRRNQIPPLLAAAATKLPSADEATALQRGPPWLLVVQLAPEFVEKAERADDVPPTVTSLVPSADAAIETKSELATLFDIHETPRSVEV